MKAYVHLSNKRADGRLDALSTTETPVRETLLSWQKAGLSYTRSGYGKRIPTAYMVKFAGRWRRVYACVFSNAGTLYIGDFGRKSGETMTVQIDAGDV